VDVTAALNHADLAAARAVTRALVLTVSVVVLPRLLLVVFCLALRAFLKHGAAPAESRPSASHGETGPSDRTRLSVSMRSTRLSTSSSRWPPHDTREFSVSVSVISLMFFNRSRSECIAPHMSASACRTLAADGCARTASPAARCPPGWAAHTGWAAASAPVVAAAAAAAGQVARPPPRAMPRFAHTTSMPMSCSRQHDSAERKRRANRADGVARRPPSHSGSGGGEARGPPQSRVSTCTTIHHSQHLVGTQSAARARTITW
jgi:hypothetical protein